ncbi:MAG: hypothetical protein ACUVT1_11130 [Anaerolineae bacterium]
MSDAMSNFSKRTLAFILSLLLLFSFAPSASALVPHGAIQGTVTCEGNPVRNTVVSVAGPLPSTSVIWTGTTHAAGVYFTDFVLPIGDYTGQLFYREGVCQFAEPIKPATVAGGSTTIVDFSGTACADIIQNGSFETMDVWQVGPTPWPARYSTTNVHSGARSMRSGIEPAEPDRVTESSFYQRITIPADATNVTLAFWYLPFTQETPATAADWREVSWAGYDPRRAIAGEPMIRPEAMTQRDASAYWYAHDWQEVLVLDSSYRLLEVLMRERSDDGAGGWIPRSFDLTPYKGRTINIYFNTINNGIGNKRTWMYVDDVQLFACAQPPACPLTPSNQWVNLYGLDSQFHGAPLPPSKVLRAYDSAGTLAGCFVVRSSGRYGAMPVYADDPETPEDEGLTPGERIRLTIDGEPAMALGPDEPIWTENGALLHVELAVGGAITRTLPLRFGWNLISFDVMPLDTRIEAVLAPIAGRFSRVLGFSCTAGAQSYYPSLPPGMNTLTTMDPYHGYWIYATEPVTLTVSGPEMPDSIPIRLCERWNLVSYLPDGPLPVLQALDSLEGQFRAVLGFDAGGLSYYPDLPPEMNTLQSLRPGLGYWIRMNQAGTLTYPPAGLGLMNALVQSIPQGAGSSLAGLHPTNRWADAYSLRSTLDGQPLPAGSVIEAFDPDGVKIGRFVVVEAGKFGPMPLYGDDPYTPEDEGAQPGDRITFTINGLRALTSPARPIWSGEYGLMQIDLRTSAGMAR